MSEVIVVIEKQKRFKLLDWKELVRYRDLLYFLVVRGVKAKYAQSILGIGWAVIQPLLTMLIFTVVFGRLAKISSDGIPYALFSFCALIPWTYFSGVLTEGSNSLIANTNMLSKVYFPRLVLPLSVLVAKLLDFGITMLVMAGLLIIFRFTPSWQIVYLPLIFILLLATSFGPAVLLAGLSIQYRDIKYAQTFLVQVLMYAAPVVYPLSLVPEKYRLVYAINPMVGVIEGFRTSVLGTGPMPWDIIGVSALSAIILLFFGLYTFSRLERTFADVS